MSKCAACGKGIYPMDPKINLDGSVYHMTCAKCAECNCQITLANFTKVDGGLMCKTHYLKSFKESGGKYVSKVSVAADKKPVPPPPAIAVSAATQAEFVSRAVPFQSSSQTREVPQPQASTQSAVRSNLAAAPLAKGQVELGPPPAKSPPEPTPLPVGMESEEEESTPVVEAEPMSSQFFEELSTAEEEAPSAPAVMSEEEFAAVFESGASLSAPPPPRPSVSQSEESEVEAVAPSKTMLTRISALQAGIPGANPSRRTKHTIPRPSNDFSDLDYDILTVKTNLVYGYVGEYDAEGKKCGRGIYKYPGAAS